MTVKVYFPDKGSIGFFEKPASPDFWDRHWQTEGSLQFATGRPRNFFSNLVGRYVAPTDGPILEGGCGMGQNVYALKMSGFEALGIDFAQETIRRIQASPIDIDIRYGDVRSLPFGNDHFAGYLSLGVIEHFREGYQAALVEMHRVLKPGGYLFLSVPYMSPLRRIKALLGLYGRRIPEGSAQEFYQFALDGRRVVRNFADAGFALVYRRPMDGIKGFKDEVTFGRGWLQELYNGKRRFRHKGRLDNLLSRVAGHIMLFVFRKM